jgi:excisionase family DNA binding protein
MMDLEQRISRRRCPAPHKVKLASLSGLSGRFCGSATAKINSFTTVYKYVIYITYMAKPCNTQQAAKATGVAVMTLYRWVVAKRLKAPKLRIRNGRAVRLWGKADLAQLQKLKQEIYCKGRGRKKGYKRK